jgi:hypothetical protein
MRGRAAVLGLALGGGFGLGGRGLVPVREDEDGDDREDQDADDGVASVHAVAASVAGAAGGRRLKFPPDGRKKLLRFLTLAT